jgi:hypothetical protein
MKYDDAWSWEMYEKFLGNVLPQWTRQGRGLVAFRGNSAFVQYVQRQAHVDLAMELLNGVLGIDWKCVRYPHFDGAPGNRHWDDFLFEMMSSTIPGHEAQGWGINSTADMVLWAQASLREDSVTCWPLPLKRWRAWVARHHAELTEVKIENIIDGRPLWTVCLKTPITRVCRDLNVFNFRVDVDGLVVDGDLFGIRKFRFLPDGTVQQFYESRRA